MPFVTDELWTALTGHDSVMMAAWPTFAARRQGGRGRDRVADAAGHRDPPVPLRPGPAARAAGPGPAGRDRATPLAAHEASIRSLLRLTADRPAPHADAGPTPASPASTSRRRWRPRASPSSSTWPAPSTWRPSARGWRRTWPPPARRRPRWRPSSATRLHRPGARRRRRQVPAAPGRRGGRYRPPAGQARVTPLTGAARWINWADQNAITTRSRLSTVDIEERLREVELEVGSRRAEHQISPTLDRVAALVSPARRPAARVPGRPRHRHQRQDLDHPDDRDPAARARAAHRPVHLAAPGVDARADRGRRRAAQRRALRRALRGDRALRRSWSTTSSRPRCPSSRSSPA